MNSHDKESLPLLVVDLLPTLQHLIYGQECYLLHHKSDHTNLKWQGQTD